ncbi:MAG: hypothetical protein ABJQ84_13830 [Ekhidna sp.]|uniref:hypothetical protein n=1 Tax=Ekhidna sp. TaxID=2608089 RepID=UPI003296E057
MKKLIFKLFLYSAIVAPIFSNPCFGQNISNQDLSMINGSWEGQLTYVDYGDDQTQYSLDTKLFVTWKNSKGKLKFEFKEPNGKLVYSTENMKLLNESEFEFDSKWQIADFEKSSSGWTLLLEMESTDNNRPSTLRQEIKLENSKLSITKMVMYDGTKSFFMRNQYELKKTSQ